MQYNIDITWMGLMRKELIDWKLSQGGLSSNFLVLDRSKIIQSCASNQDQCDFFNLIYYTLHGIRTRQPIEYLTICFRSDQFKQVFVGCFDILNKKAFYGCLITQLKEKDRNFFDLFF